MCKVIAIGNNKGGVAKTTTAVNLAKGLADAGKRVLLIDADPQGNATAAVGYDEPDLIEDNLAKVIVMERKDIEIEPGYGILHNKGGFDVLPGNIELSEVELEIMSAMHRESILDQYVTMMRPMYDYIIIDCAPSLGLLTTNAFVAADSILIPVQASYLPIKGLEQLVRHITQIKKHINFDLYIEGILLTMVDARTNMAKRVIDTIQGAYGSKVKMFSMNIPRSVKAAISRYAKRGGRNLIGQSLLNCHNSQSNEMINKVINWFLKDEHNNMIYTYKNEKENKDVYMVALRDDSNKLIGYYEKHEYRNAETANIYDFSKSLI